MGTFRRLIRITCRTGEARGAVQDDYHHFRVRICHDGQTINSIQADAFRHPWDLCALAPSAVKRLTGMPLKLATEGSTETIDARAHCTHLLDLSELMLRLAIRGVDRREYEIEIPYRIDHNTTASLRRDGEAIFQWRVEGSRILTPPPFAGRDIGRGFAKFIKDTFDSDAAEAALVLSRAVHVSSGRGNQMDGIVKAPTSGVCFVQNPQRGPLARRWFHTRKDLTNSLDSMRQGDDEWLDGSFEDGTAGLFVVAGEPKPGDVGAP